MKRTSNHRGVALVSVLWVIVLLSIIASTLVVTVRTESTLAQELKASAQARALAEAGVFRGIFELLNPKQRERWKGDGRAYRVRFGGGRVTIRLQDQGGLIDLNAARRDLLDALLRVNGAEEDVRASVVDAILDWRDVNDLRSLHGAEDDDYVAAGRRYGAKDGLFNTVEELQQVLGVRPALYRRIAAALTVHSHQNGVDARVAPPQVLKAVFIGDASGADLETLQENAAKAEEDASLESQEGELAAALDRRFLVRSEGIIFTVTAEAKVPPYGAAHIEATVKMTGNEGGLPYTIMTWKEGR
ncbi:MAG: general secretion pathway protein GspK [Gammaproteobacteria bacterium]